MANLYWGTSVESTCTSGNCLPLLLCSTADDAHSNISPPATLICGVGKEKRQTVPLRDRLSSLYWTFHMLTKQTTCQWIIIILPSSSSGCCSFSTQCGTGSWRRSLATVTHSRSPGHLYIYTQDQSSCQIHTSRPIGPAIYIATCNEDKD